MSWRSTIKPASSGPSGWRSTIKPADEAASQDGEDAPDGLFTKANDFLNPGITPVVKKLAPGLLRFGDDAANYLVDEVVEPVGRTIDTYSGAPTRSALSAGLRGENPFPAFGRQFGEDPKEAPSGKDIARQVGVPDTAVSDILPGLYSDTGDGLALERGGLLDPTASGAAGLVVDIGADISNVVPFGALAKAAKPISRAQDVISASPRATGLIEGGKDAAKTFTGAVSKVTNPKQSPGFPAAKEIATRHGFGNVELPPSVEFPPESFISRASRVVAEGPAGEEYLTAYKNADEAVGAAIERSVAKAAKGKPLDLFSGGSAIKEGYDTAKDALLSGADITYEKIQKYAPGLYLDKDAASKLDSTLNGIEKYAKGRLADRGATADVRQQGKLLLANIAAIRKGNGSLKQTVEALKDIGRKAFQKKTTVGVIPHDTKKMGDMYFAMRDAIVDTARKHISPEMADELVSNNAKISDFLKNSSEFEKFLDLPPEKIIPAIASDTKRLGAFKATVGPDVFSQLKGAYVQDLIPKNAQGDVMFGSLVKALRKDGAVLKTLLDPGEYSALNELASLGASFGPPVMSSSGTGASNGFLKMIRGIFDSTVTKKTIDAMKSKARKTGIAGPASKRTPTAPVRNEGGFLMESEEKLKSAPTKPRGLLREVGGEIRDRTAGKRRGLIGQSAKGAQVYSAGDDE